MLRVVRQTLNIFDLDFDYNVMAVIWILRSNVHTISNCCAKYEHSRSKGMKEEFSLRELDIFKYI